MNSRVDWIRLYCFFPPAILVFKINNNRSFVGELRGTGPHELFPVLYKMNFEVKPEITVDYSGIT